MNADTITMWGGGVIGIAVAVLYAVYAVQYAKRGNGYTKGFALLLLSSISIAYASALYLAVVLHIVSIVEYPRLIRPDATWVVLLPAAAIVWLNAECKCFRR